MGNTFHLLQKMTKKAANETVSSEANMIVVSMLSVKKRQSNVSEMSIMSMSLLDYFVTFSDV